MAQSNYVVIKQSYSESDESYKWQIVSDPVTLRSASNIISKSREYMPGDILVVCDLAEVSDIINKAKSIYAIDELGEACKAPRLYDIFPYNDGTTWLGLYIGTEVKVSDLLFISAASGLSERAITKAAYLCAAAAYDGLEKDDLHMEAIDAVESFLSGNKINQTHYDKLCKKLKNRCVGPGIFKSSHEYETSAMYWYLVKSMLEPLEAYSVTLSITRMFRGGLDHKMLSILRDSIPLSAIIVAAAKSRKKK